MKLNILQNLPKRISLSVALAATSCMAFAQSAYDLMQPFGFVTVNSRTDAASTFNFTAGGTLVPDVDASGAIVLLSDGEGVDMMKKVADAIAKNKVIIMDGSNGDFTISSVMKLNGISGKTIVGINNARLCTKWYMTDEIRELLDSKNIKTASTSSGTGGKLSNGVEVSEEAELLTRQALLDKYGNENYRNSGIFYIQNCNNIAIRNITFVGPGSVDVSGYDLMSVYGSKHIWVDHCDFIDGIDGNLDITQKADFNTVSWCTFSYTDRSYMHQNTNLIGSSDSEATGYLNTTMAYNVWGKGCRARMPMGRVGKIHVLNNYYNCKGNGSVCINPRKNSEFMIEGNYFSSDVSKIFDQKDATAYVWSTSNIIARSGVSTPSSKGDVDIPYTYNVIDAKLLPDELTKHAGATLFRDPSEINEIMSDNYTKSHRFYNLQGQQVDSTTKGIVICNGKKYIQK